MDVYLNMSKNISKSEFKFKNPILILGLGSIMSISLCCCTTSPKTESTGSQIEQSLETTAKSVAYSLRRLAEAQETQSVTAINTSPLVTSEGGMGSTATIDWSGPIEALLEKVANLTNYKVKILGQEPSIPVVVTIAASNSIVADILKDAGLQAGKKADLVVYPSTRIIELRYLDS